MIDLSEPFVLCCTTDKTNQFFRLLLIIFIGVFLNACQTTPNILRYSGHVEQSIETTRFILKRNESVIGQLATVEVRKGESLPDIARHFGLGYQEITNANPDIDVWAPDDGSQVRLPLQFILPNAPREGIVLNLANMRLFFFPVDQLVLKTVMSYSTGIGREGWSTPLGKSRIIGKNKSPKWHVPASIRREHALEGDPLPAVVPAGPNNPLGQYAMRLSMPDYLIHGTNKPYGVGLKVSHGCVRLYPEAIEELFQKVSVGTPVRIVNQPYLIGWQNGMLYLEAHKPSPAQIKSSTGLKGQLIKKLKKYAGDAGATIDWDKVAVTLSKSDGIPTSILEEQQKLTRFFYTLPLVARPQQLYGMPPIPLLKQGDWSIIAGSFLQESNAIQLAAILNHQGPQIPSRVVKRNSHYRVVSGPFIDQDYAKKISRQMLKNQDLETWVIKVD